MGRFGESRRGKMEEWPASQKPKKKNHTDLVASKNEETYQFELSTTNIHSERKRRNAILTRTENDMSDLDFPEVSPQTHKPNNGSHIQL